MATAHRYPHLTLVDDEGVTVHYDLCKRCAKAWMEADVIDIGPMSCPEVGIEEGYTCDRCGTPITLTEVY
jgi:hypothetical protein